MVTFVNMYIYSYTSEKAITEPIQRAVLHTDEDVPDRESLNYHIDLLMESTTLMFIITVTNMNSMNRVPLRHFISTMCHAVSVLHPVFVRRRRNSSPRIQPKDNPGYYRYRTP